MADRNAAPTIYGGPNATTISEFIGGTSTWTFAAAIGAGNVASASASTPGVIASHKLIGPPFASSWAAATPYVIAAYQCSQDTITLTASNPSASGVAAGAAFTGTWFAWR